MVENTTGVTTVAASDIDGQPLAYSIAGGLDAARFSIDAVTGVLTFNPAPNFEAPADSGPNNVYDVVVRVDDGAGGSDTQALAIAVTDANDAPFVTGDAYTVVEDNALSIAAPGALGNDGDEDLERDHRHARRRSGERHGRVQRRRHLRLHAQRELRRRRQLHLPRERRRARLRRRDHDDHA